MLACVPASRIIAILVEKKHHTFTIGGASFVGIIISPWAIMLTATLLDRAGLEQMVVLPVLAALSICYTLGEGLGRLGCISYGCCYGKPLSQCSPFFQKLFKRLNFCFTGSNQKAVYEGNLSGQALVPIQAITAILYTATSLAGCFLFLHNLFSWAVLLPILVTQGWRILSETLRADFRGFTKISAYQKMGFIAILYMAAITGILPSMLPQEQAAAFPSITAGLTFIWQPGIILGLQILWLCFFIFFGKSTITSAEITYQLIHERI